MLLGFICVAVCYPALNDLSPHFQGITGAFIIRNLRTGKTQRYNPKQCAKRLSPCSTFKIVNCAISIEEGIIADENSILKWDGKRNPFVEKWNSDLTVQQAMAYSAVPHFQRLASAIGAKRMQRYLDAIDYGNRDISSGLTTFWLAGSLKVSADEQIVFLEKFFTGKHPVFRRSVGAVKKAIELAKTDNGTLYGKTGTQAGDSLGWFVGLVEEADGDSYAFAMSIEGQSDANGKRAKHLVIAILKEMELL